MTHSYRYDVAVTFAGEDRAFVLAVVERVKAVGFRVFYDQDEQVTLWGEELTEYFPRIYEQQARFAVMFISRQYAAKPWTRLERRSVLARALDQDSPYVLPVRLDDTTLPGLRTTISYLDGARLGPAAVAEAIQHKLGAPRTDAIGAFNGHVPRNEDEAAIVVGERPAAWEYLLFSYSLVRGIENLNERYLDHRMGFAETADPVSDADVYDVAQGEMARISSIVANFNTVLNRESQTVAFGAPGEPGDPSAIAHLASRYVRVYESFMDWSARLRGYATKSTEARRVFSALAHYSDQPVERLRDFTYEFRGLVDPMHAELVAGRSVELSLTVALEIPEETSQEVERALSVFHRHRR